MTLTRAQRIALKSVYDRRPVYRLRDGTLHYPTLGTGLERIARDCFARASYREFRRAVVPGSGCIMVPWCGMWLGIEPDGYTHS